MTKRWTWYFAFLLLLSSILDIFSTYYASPDLSGEVNPLVIAMGRSWTAIFAVKGITQIVVPVIFFFSLQALDGRSMRLVGKKGFVEILSYLFFEKYVSMTSRSVEWPKDWGAVAAFMGVCIAVAAALGSLLAAISNTFHLVRSFMHLYLLDTVILLSSIVLSHYLAYYFLSISIKVQDGNAGDSSIASRF
jgi:hypothetical protein